MAESASSQTPPKQDNLPTILIGGGALVMVMVVVLLVGFSIGGQGSGLPNPSGSTKAQPIDLSTGNTQIHDLLSDLKSKAKPQQFLTDNATALNNQLSAALDKRTTSLTDGVLKDNPKKKDALAIIDQMRAELNLITTNATSNQNLARQKATNFIDNITKLNQLLNTQDQAFPVSLAAGGLHYRNDWGDVRANGARQHRGNDIFAPRGTDILAVADGTITLQGVTVDKQSAAHNAPGFQFYLKPDGSADDRQYYYDHVINVRVQAGDKVVKGQVLAQVGYLNHLHFSIRDDSCALPGADGSHSGQTSFCWINPFTFLASLDPSPSTHQK